MNFISLQHIRLLSSLVGFDISLIYYL